MSNATKFSVGNLLLENEDAPKLKFAPGEKKEFDAWFADAVTPEAAGKIWALPSSRVNIVHLDGKVKEGTELSGFNCGFRRTHVEEIGGRVVSNFQLQKKAARHMVNWPSAPQKVFRCHACGRDVIDVIGSRTIFEQNPGMRLPNFAVAVLWDAGGKPGDDTCVVCPECMSSRQNMLKAVFRAGLSAAGFAQDGGDVLGYIAHNENVGRTITDLAWHIAGGANPDSVTKDSWASGMTIDWLLHQHNRVNDAKDAQAARLVRQLEVESDEKVAEEEVPTEA